MKFGNLDIDFSQRKSPVIIGEIGVNHNGDGELLFKLIDAGIETGLDVIKLQRFVSRLEISQYAPSTDYQRNAGEGDNQLKMAEALELSDELLLKAKDYCLEKNIGFLCAGFEHESVDFIADKLGCSTIKAPSPELNNKPLVDHMARKFDSLILSSGASYLHECLTAQHWVQQIADRELVFLHCTSEYPAPTDQINLSAITTMQHALQTPIGYSDHTDGTLAAVVSTSLGSVMLEKHYTLDKDLPGPDHKASADIAELQALVRLVRATSASLGDSVKRPCQAESANRPLIRKSLTINSQDVKAGTLLTRDMLGIKRPEVVGAVQPEDFEKVIGLRVQKDKDFDQPLLWSDFTA